MPFRERLRENDKFGAIPFNLKDYLELVDWTGRAVRNNKKGYLPQDRPKLIDKLGLSDTQWRILALEIQKQSITMLNGLESLATIDKRAQKNTAA